MKFTTFSVFFPIFEHLYGKVYQRYISYSAISFNIYIFTTVISQNIIVYIICVKSIWFSKPKKCDFWVEMTFFVIFPIFEHLYEKLYQRCISDSEISFNIYIFTTDKLQNSIVYIYICKIYMVLKTKEMWFLGRNYIFGNFFQYWGTYMEKCIKDAYLIPIFPWI